MFVTGRDATACKGTKTILLHYDTMNNPSNAHHGLDMQTWSNDDGKSQKAMQVLATSSSCL